MIPKLPSERTSSQKCQGRSHHTYHKKGRGICTGRCYGYRVNVRFCEHRAAIAHEHVSFVSRLPNRIEKDLLEVALLTLVVVYGDSPLVHTGVPHIDTPMGLKRPFV